MRLDRIARLYLSRGAATLDADTARRLHRGTHRAFISIVVNGTDLLCDALW